MANRKERVPALILKNISEIIQYEVKSKSIGFVTVTDVDVSNDFSHAKVYVSFLGVGNKEERLAALERTKGFIRSSLAQKWIFIKFLNFISSLMIPLKKVKRLKKA